MLCGPRLLSYTLTRVSSHFHPRTMGTTAGMWVIWPAVKVRLSLVCHARPDFCAIPSLATRVHYLRQPRTGSPSLSVVQTDFKVSIGVMSQPPSGTVFKYEKGEVGEGPELAEGSVGA